MYSTAFLRGIFFRCLAAEKVVARKQSCLSKSLVGFAAGSSCSRHFQPPKQFLISSKCLAITPASVFSLRFAVTKSSNETSDFDVSSKSSHSSIESPRFQTPKRKSSSRKGKLTGKGVDFGGHRFPCSSYATADEFENMPKLQMALADSYIVHTLPEDVGDDAIFCSIRKQNEESNGIIPALRKDFVIFWDGVVVFWNCTEEDQLSVFEILRLFERGPHPLQLVESEVEHLEYVVSDGGPSRIVKNTIVLSSSCSPLTLSESDSEIEPSVLTKLAFSEALRLSVRLGIWESQLLTVAESVDGVIDDLRAGRRLRISRSDVLRHCGDLLSFRHRVNLDSDLLQIPDWYWDRAQLEELFRRTRGFLNVPHRTRLVNEKLNHCFELIELLRSHLNDSHHTRLEWMIIALIMIEVIFDAIPALGRFFMP